MKTAFRIAALWATGCMVAAGCDGDLAPTQGEEAVNTAPVTLEEAQLQLEKIDGLVGKQGATPALIAKARLIRDRMEQLNGLVDRIEIAPQHALVFMAGPDGLLFVAERAPAGTASALGGVDPASIGIDQLYARFAPGRQIPAALLTRTASSEALGSVERAPATEVIAEVSGGAPAAALRQAGATEAAGDTTVARSALTGSAADANTFRAYSCPSGGVFPFCLLNWGGGASATSTSDHSLVSVAPYAGGGSVSFNSVYKGNATGTWSAVMGEWVSMGLIGPTISVKDDPSCIIFNCTTHYEAKRITHTWNVFNAVGKEFHFGGRFYNKPRTWNQL